MIRDAYMSDFDAVLNLENQVFQIHINAHPDMIKPKLPLNKDYYEKCLQDENFKVLVFEENETILGFCIAQILVYKDHYLFYDMKTLEISDMCVDEKARGRSIGRQLVNSAKVYAKECGATRLELSVWWFNKNARQFYEHLGMTERTCRMEMILE